MFCSILHCIYLHIDLFISAIYSNLIRVCFLCSKCILLLIGFYLNKTINKTFYKYFILIKYLINRKLSFISLDLLSTYTCVSDHLFKHVFTYLHKYCLFLYKLLLLLF